MSPNVNESFWIQTQGKHLAQGDLLPACQTLQIPSGISAGQKPVIDFELCDLIILTQSCDLENRKVEYVTLCPIFTLNELKVAYPFFLNVANIEQIRQGKFVAYHMLSSPDQPELNTSCRIVDFRETHSLPLDFAENHAIQLGPRWRLKPPYLEHFSQAFARFFMRVGLPSSIPPFKK